VASGGIVYLVGAGPGDPGLFTVRGMELLRRAEVVIYDGLVNPELLRFVTETAEIIYGGKHDRTRAVSQDEINALLVAKAREGKQVVRLKGGDPYVFGRGGEEAEVLAEADIPFEVVPGVSSFHAVPGYAGIPLTHPGQCPMVTIVTGHDDPQSSTNKLNWAELARTSGTLVVLMGLANIPQIAAALIAHGRSPETPVAVISRGTTRRQAAISGSLATIANQLLQAHLPPPAVTVIGEAARLSSKLGI
jgi:uroporphyrinogen III methyltransferase / synthase